MFPYKFLVENVCSKRSVENYWHEVKLIKKSFPCHVTLYKIFVITYYSTVYNYHYVDNHRNIFT